MTEHQNQLAEANAEAVTNRKAGYRLYDISNNSYCEDKNVDLGIENYVPVLPSSTTLFSGIWRRVRMVEKSRGLSTITWIRDVTISAVRPTGLPLDQVPNDFHEPFILSGYRFHNIGPYQCLKSAFLERNNEAINVWTHFLPSIYFLWKFYGYLGEVNLSDEYFLPWCLYFLTLVVYPLMSCFAHAFNNMSVRARHVCFFVDYVGCSLYTFGAAVLYHAYAFPESAIGTIFDKYFIWIAAFNALACTTAACGSRFLPGGTVRKVARVLAFGFPYLYDNLPIVYRLCHAYGSSDSDQDALRCYCKQLLMTVLSVLFYVWHFPERFLPGHFDLIGHSHQLFHVFSALASAYQMEGSWIDLQSRRQLLMQQSHWENVTLAPRITWIVLVANIMLISYFSILVVFPRPGSVVKTKTSGGVQSENFPHN